MTTTDTARFRVAELPDGQYEIRDHDTPEDGRGYTTCSGYSGDPQFAKDAAERDCAALNAGTKAPDPIWYRPTRDADTCELEVWDRAPGVWQWDCLAHDEGASGFVSSAEAAEAAVDCPGNAAA